VIITPEVSWIPGARKLEYRQALLPAAVAVNPGQIVSVPDNLGILPVYVSYIYTATATAGSRFVGFQVWDGLTANYVTRSTSAIVANGIQQMVFSWFAVGTAGSSNFIYGYLPVATVMNANTIQSSVVGVDGLDTITNWVCYYFVWLK